MSVTTKLLTGVASLAALAGFATPAVAQYYPGYGYPANNNNNIVGAIINSVTGYGRYPYGNYGYNQYGNQYGSQYGYNQNMAVDQCARAVEARLNGGNGYYGYGNVPYGGGYNGYRNGNGYNNGNAGGRVQGITKVDRNSYGVKVHGVASSGYRGYDGYGRQGYGNYGYNAGADLSFNCEVRADGRIRDIDIKRRTASWRGY